MEAIGHYGCNNNVLILKERRSEIAESQIARILDSSQWHSIIKMPRHRENFFIPKLVSLLYKIRKANPTMTFEKVFYANYSSWIIAVIMANLKTRTEVMIDDGTLTLFEYEHNIDTGKVLNVSRPKKEFWLKMFGFNGARKVFPRPAFKLFTMFSIPEANVSIDLNRFTSLKNRYRLEEVYNENGDIVFIGNGSTNRGLDMNKYYKNISSLDKGNCKIFYFPHRNESADVSRRLSSITTLEYVRTAFPIEIQLKTLPNGVRGIYGFYSSALYSLSLIYPNIPIYTRKLRDDELQNASIILREAIDHYQKYLVGKNIRQWKE